MYRGTDYASVSRPGTAKTAHEHMFWADPSKESLITLNFPLSGSAKAEDAIIDYIAGLNMGVFVYDYEHNAPTVEHLQVTHEKMFLTIRERHPDLPVIFMSRPSDIDRKRREIIETTYNNAVARGDKKVYIVKPAELNMKDGTVDGCHPNDLGFYYMARGLAPVL